MVAKKTYVEHCFMSEGEGYFADLKVDMSFKKTFANEDEKEPLIVMLNVFLSV
jgi:hypothetical protein